MLRLPPIHKVRELIAGSTWPKKTTNLLAGLIIFFSATQLGYHFWPESAFIYGLRVDYLSPTLYFLDVLIICYLVIRNCLIIDYWKLRFIVPLLLVNLLFSQNPWATLSWSIHFLLYLSFIYVLPIYDIRHATYKALSISILFQIVLALVQVTLGHSLQGPLYYLGERMVSVGLPNIAVGSFMGQVVLRAYGTFSHPNILAGYLVISFLIILSLAMKRKLSTMYYVLYTFLVSLGILLTQSRSATLAFFGLVIPFSVLKSFRSRILYISLFLCSIFYVLYSGSLSRPLDLSISERLSLQQVSTKVIRAYPIFGTGTEASITRYPDLSPNFRLFQPDHNSFTLFLSWFGVIGILVLLFLFRSQFNNLKIYDLKLFLPLLPLLLLDHYLLTSPQGMFILLLYLRIVWIKRTNESFSD